MFEVVHIAVTMKPLGKRNFAEAVLAQGVAGLNVDECRIVVLDDAYKANCSGDRGHSGNKSRDMEFKMGCGKSSELGRFPANVVHDGSEKVMVGFPVTTQVDKRQRVIQHQPPGQNGIYGTFKGVNDTPVYGDSGSASKFFKKCSWLDD